MKKRVLSMLLALVLTVGLLPVSAAAVSESDEAAIRSAVSKVITEYAKKVYKPNADDDAFNLFFKQGFYGNGKDMILEESSPMVSALFNSGLMQEGLIQGLTDSIAVMQDNRLDVMTVMAGFTWHDYYYDYSFMAYNGSELDAGNYIGKISSTRNNYQGPRNENDTVMELLAGGLYTDVLIEKAEVHPDEITYEISFIVKDDFDFHGGYDGIAENGYDTSMDDSLVNLGWMLTFIGLDEFYWEYKIDFTIAVPNVCNHESGNYRWIFDGQTVTMKSVTEDGFTVNETTKNVYQTTSSKTGKLLTRYYHELDDRILLSHDQPWIIEYDQVGLRNLQFGSQTAPTGIFPIFHAEATNCVWLHYVQKVSYPGAEKGGVTSKEAYDVNHYLGLWIKDQFEYNKKHGYTTTIENVIGSNGDNMLYLTIYDQDLGEIVFGPEPMDDHRTKGPDDEDYQLESTESNLISGMDLTINYLGSKNVSLGSSEMTLDMRVYPYGKDGTASDGSEYQAPTCTEQGGMVHTCIDCGCHYLTESIPALGHTFGDYSFNNNATCIADGTQSRTCSVCGQKETVTASGTALGHSYNAIVTEPTLTEQGYTTYTCTVCGDSYKDDYTDKKEHKYVPVVTEPTCIAEGYTTYTCSECGDSYVDDYTEMAEHTPVVDPAVAPTCVEKGKTEGSHCGVCGEVLKKQANISTVDRHNYTEEITKVPTYEEAGEVTYTCKDCGKVEVKVVPPFEKPTANNPFTDVAETDWFYEPVLWALQEDVTKGKTETTFAPYEGCTRAQVVTFLWAANGKPEPESMENPFGDVAEDAWYLKPVLWAVEQGITTGISETEFGPEQTCTRAQIATFLWAAKGRHAVTSESTFADITGDEWFAAPVIWAVENEVTSGIDEGKFGPEQTCTRAQVVTFLYKVYG